MASSKSHLSDPQFGYDLVVATTQVSINDNLKHYLGQNAQAPTYYCFLAGQSQIPRPVPLDEFLQTCSINPFDIPAGTPVDDPRIATLTAAYFAVGIRLEAGIPLGVLPIDLPVEIVDFSNGISAVTLNMFCRTLTIVENNPWTAQWNVHEQPRSDGTWYFSTTVNMVTEALDPTLNTTYFNNNPVQKQNILERLRLLTSPFSLQQLLLDLEGGTQSNPSPGMQHQLPPNSLALMTSAFHFLEVWNANINERGNLPLSIGAVANQSALSQLSLTALELSTNPFTDPNTGNPIEFPDGAQRSATTLNYFCAVNNNALPGSKQLNWNWVDTTELKDRGGIVSVNRNLVARIFLDQLIPTASQSCYAVKTFTTVDNFTVNYNIALTSGQTPNSSIPVTGPTIARIEYTSSDESWVVGTLASGQLKAVPSYTCDVTVSGNTITVVQHLWMWTRVQYDLTPESLNVYDKIATDVFTLSVSDHGQLLFTRSPTQYKDQAQKPDNNWVLEIFTGLNQVLEDFQNQVHDLGIVNLTPSPLNKLQNFIFPGVDTFTYMSPLFSNYQDLTCIINYTDTDPSQISPPVAVTQQEQHSMLTLKEIDVLSSRADQKNSTYNSEDQLQQALVSPDAPSTLNLVYSTEMLQNYLQGSIISPTSQFEALQTSAGHGLLFGIDTSGVFHVIQEQNGMTQTGWTLTDLSTAALTSQLPGAKVRAFDVGQSSLDGTIDLAMAASGNASDMLFISLSNANGDTEALNWIAQPSWTMCPFDAVGETPGTIHITNVMFPETLGLSQQKLVVDIDRSPNSPVKDIARYYIDPTKSTGTYWQANDVKIDIEDGTYQSCIGQSLGADVDGIYTAGLAAGVAQIDFEPLVNVDGSGPITPTIFNLPGNVVATAIATARRDVDDSDPFYGTTDLYLTDGSSLFLFTADNQNENASAQTLFTDDSIAGTDELRAMDHAGLTTIWWKNGSDQVYYSSCDTSNISNPGSWSVPVPILSSVERISTYVNRSDGGNTVYTSGDSKLHKLMQATTSSTKMWQSQELKLQAQPQEESIAFNSYTTALHISDVNSFPVQGTVVAVTAKSRTPVYINGLYYVLGQTPVNVTTDAIGAINIIEATENINGTVLTVSAPGIPTTIINPMDQSMNKVAALNSKKKLQSATFTSDPVAGGTISSSQSSNLVSTSTPGPDLDKVARSMGNLKSAYDSVNIPERHIPAISKSRAIPRDAAGPASASSLEAIEIAAGDLFRWLKSGVEAVIDVVKDVEKDVWNFVATIAGQVYSAVLDAVDAVIGAIEWVFHAIETAIEDLIHFVEFLFEWDDIRRTKDVMYNVVNLYLQNISSDIVSLQQDFDNQISHAEAVINNWSGNTDWSSLGGAVTQPATSSTANPNQDQTSGSNMLSHHFRQQSSNITVVGDSPTVDVAQQLIDDLLTAIQNEGKVLAAVYSSLKQLAHDFQSLTVAEVLKRIAGILADAFLSSVQVVVDALLNVLASLTGSLIGALTTNIHIPIISDILDKIGIPEISFLDLFMWIAAVAYTVVYKIKNDTAPFSANDPIIQQVISAPSWENLVSLFLPDSKSQNLSLKAENQIKTAALSASDNTLSSLQTTLFAAGHGLSTILNVILIPVGMIEANQETGGGLPSNLSCVLQIAAMTCSLVVDSLAPEMPLKDKSLGIFLKATNSAIILAKIFFAGPVQSKLGAAPGIFSGLKAKDGRATGSLITTLMTTPLLVGICEHLNDMMNSPSTTPRTAAILGEVSNICTCIQRLVYAAAINQEDPQIKGAEVIIYGISIACVAGVQAGEALVV